MRILKFKPTAVQESIRFLLVILIQCIYYLPERTPLILTMALTSKYWTLLISLACKSKIKKAQKTVISISLATEFALNLTYRLYI